MTSQPSSAEAPSVCALPQPLPPSRAERLQTWLLVPLCLLLAAGCCLTIDVPVAQWAHAKHHPKFLRDLLDNAEPFGHGCGIALLMITLCIAEPRRRLALGWVAISAAAGGLGANLVKLLCVARTRPRSFDLQHAGDVWQTFGAWLPFGAGGSSQQSFPSAHTATAMAFAVGLWQLYPRLRVWLCVLTALVALHRIESSAHYPSDVCAGACIGWLCGHAVTRARLAWAARSNNRDELSVVAPDARRCA